jgi:hypothetical protein
VTMRREFSARRHSAALRLIANEPRSYPAVTLSIQSPRTS